MHFSLRAYFGNCPFSGLFEKYCETKIQCSSYHCCQARFEKSILKLVRFEIKSDFVADSIVDHKLVIPAAGLIYYYIRRNIECIEGENKNGEENFHHPVIDNSGNTVSVMDIDISIENAEGKTVNSVEENELAKMCEDGAESSIVHTIFDIIFRVVDSTLILSI